MPGNGHTSGRSLVWKVMTKSGCEKADLSLSSVVMVTLNVSLASTPTSVKLYSGGG